MGLQRRGMRTDGGSGLVRGGQVVVVVLSVVVALLVSLGATFGGSLVFEYGFNVETAGDHPVWHKSETDVFAGEHGEEEPS